MHSGELILSLRRSFRRFMLTGFCQTLVGHPHIQRIFIRLFIPPIAPALDLIDAAEAQLRGTAGTMEARFLESGSALEDLSRSSHSLIENSTELVRLATGRREAEQIIADTMSVLAEPLAFLNRYTGQLGRHAASLDEGCALLDCLLNFETDLQAAVAPLRATRTMFRVEASRLPEADRAAFLALSDQIETIHNQVRDSFGTEFAKLAETRAGISKLLMQLKDESYEQHERLGREKARIEEELEKLSRQIESNSQGEVQLTVRGKVVAKAVSSVVMTLQNQDIVAQRIGHLFEGIGRIRTLGEEFGVGRSGGLADLAHLSAMVAIEKGQLSDALAHLTETGTASGSATAEILATVDAMDQECIFLKEFSEVTAAANGTIQVLLDIVDEIRNMVSSAVRVGADSLQQIQPVNSLTTQLSDSVERLSHQMNLVALNAQLQAVQTGAGTGLEVLAAHTATVATETSRLGEAIREAFERLQSFLKTETVALTELCDGGRVQQMYIENEGCAQEKQLHKTRDEILRRLHSIADDAKELRTSAERIAHSSMVSQDEAEGFARMESALSNMTAGLSDVLAVLPTGGIDLRIEHAGYTMASERENHMKIIGGAGTQEISTALDEQCQVELF